MIKVNGGSYEIVVIPEKGRGRERRGINNVQLGDGKRSTFIVREGETDLAFGRRVQEAAAAAQVRLAQA